MVIATATTTTESHQNVSCPLHILNYLETIVGSEALNDLKVKEIKSAQQQVFVIALSNSVLLSSPSSRRNDIPDFKSTVAVQDNDDVTRKKQCMWHEALKLGRARLVIRIWKGSARWWNLHQNEQFLHPHSDHPHGDSRSSSNDNGVVRLARAEVAGYRIAKQALDNTKVPNEVQIPQVLYFSLDDNDNKNYKDKDNSQNSSVVLDNDAVGSCTCHPWAIFSYVGPESHFFVSDYNDALVAKDKEENKNHRDFAKTNNHDILSTLHNTTKTTTRRLPTNEWIEGMIQVRHEFGFDEPHPRWGRVPVDQCLDYTIHLLKKVILPMHYYFFSSASLKTTAQDWKYLGVDNGVPNKNGVHTTCNTRSSNDDDDDGVRSRQYGDMLLLHKNAYDTMQKALMQQQNKVPIDEGKLECMVKLLQMCIDTLTQEAKGVGLVKNGVDQVENFTSIPPVLCHMDCQPQNLICFHYCNNEYGGKEKESFSSNEEDQLPQISSILDWEEAAFADPRFELLLLCRKVCANKEQAQTVWKFYNEQIQSNFPNFPTLGPIEPWLKLETVHSITTLLLQSMDLLGGGRNPWESKPDLYDKLEREFQRLVALGWEFCSVVNSTGI